MDGVDLTYEDQMSYIGMGWITAVDGCVIDIDHVDGSG